MKKMMLILAAAFMAVTLAGSAFAASTSLRAIIYDTSSASGVEMGIDLGNVSTFDFTAGGTLATFNLDAFGGASWENLNVAVFAGVEDTQFSGWAYTTTQSMYMSKPQADSVAASSTGGNIANFLAAANNVDAYHNGISAGVVNNKNSYNSWMNQGVPGNYAGFNATPGLGEGTLAADGTTDVFLYQYIRLLTSDGFNTTDAFTLPDSYLAKFTFSVDGDTATLSMTPAASPVPVPAAAWLLGSGLMSLVGLRRRKTV